MKSVATVLRRKDRRRLGLPEAASPPGGPPRKGFAVHEWGVFTVYADVETANVDVRHKWADLPEFVFGRTPQRVEPYCGPVLKPVIHFHTEESFDFPLDMGLPGGRAAVWWPAAERYVHPKTKAETLQFRGSTRTYRAQGGREPGLETVPDGHWFEAFRKVGAATLFVSGGRTRAVPGHVWHRENFLFYDGLLPAPDCVRVRIEGGKVLLDSRVDHAVFDVTLLDRREAGKVRVARWEKLAPRAEGVAAEFVERKADDAPRQCAARLIEQLAAAGLNRDEAESLTGIWRAGFFERPGLSMLHRLPQERYDRMLPLTVSPTPEKIVRVGLVLHPQCEPVTREAVDRILRDFDDPEFEVREAAQKRLDALGPTVVAILKGLDRGKLSAEARSRVAAVLDRFEAERLLPR